MLARRYDWTVVLSLMLGLLIVGEADAQDYEGTLNRTAFSHGPCQIRSMDVRYRFSVIMGDPVINGSYQWDAGAGTAADCLPPEVSVWLEVQNAGATRWVEIDPAEVESGAGWAYNVAGSPSLGQVFCDLGGGGCLDAAAAGDLWANGFDVVGFRLVGGEAEARQRLREAEAERRREAERQRREEEEQRAREEAEARERAEAREQARRDSVLAATEAREERQATEEARREAEREAEEERRRREVEENNEELAEAGDSISDEAEEIMEETPEEVEVAATAGAVGVLGFFGQMWGEGMLVGGSFFYPNAAPEGSFWGVSVWSPGRHKLEFMMNVQDFWATTSEGEPLDQYDLGMTFMAALDAWKWMGVYGDDSDLYGLIPYPSLGFGLHFISFDHLDYSEHWGGFWSLGGGIMWGGEASQLAVTLEAHKILGIEAAPLGPEDGIFDRDDIIIQFGFAFGPGFFSEGW